MSTEQIASLAQNQVDNITKQTETSTTHMRQLQDAIRMADQTKSETLSLQMQHEIERLRDEKRRADDDARRYRDKAEEHTDPIASVMKYKDMVDTVGALFGGVEETALVPAGAADDGIIGRVERLMDTRFGQRAGEIAGAVLGNMLQPKPPQQPQQLQQPMAPTPIQQPQQLVQAPQQPAAPKPPQQPLQAATGPVGPLSGDINMDIESALYGAPGSHGGPPAPAPAGPPTPAHPAMAGGPPPAASPPAGESLDESLARVNAWVTEAEAMIEQNAPIEGFVEAMSRNLPPEALQGFISFPIEAVVAEVTGSLKTRGVLGSPAGIAYLTRVQQALQAQAG